MKILRHLIEYGALRGLVGLCALPPRSAARSLGRSLGRAVFAAGVRRRVVDENLAAAFPDLATGQREALSRACFEHFGRILIDLASLHRWTPRELEERTLLEGFDHLERSLADGRGVVLATGHLGAIDVGPVRIQQLGRETLSIYQTVHNPHVDRYISRIRTLGSARVASRRFGMRDALRQLRRNGIVLILADQDAGPKGAFLPFFSRPASTLVGPAELALRTGAALLTGYVIEEGSKFHLRLEPPIPHSTTREMMAEYNRRLEAMIRRHPDQYFWLHRRWKSRPVP